MTLCELGAICSLGKYVAQATLHLTLTVQSAVALDIHRQPDGTMLAVGTEVHTPEAGAIAIAFDPRTYGQESVAIAYLGGKHLELNQPIDFAIAAIAAR